jgi:hypothetical protein
MWRRGSRAVAAAALVMVLAACSEPAQESSTTASGEDVRAVACAGLDLLACARLSTIADLVPDEPVVASGEPLVLGMVNQENTPVGSFPELSAAVQAAVDFVNENLGGVGGRPIEVELCNTNFSAEGSTACGQQFAESGVPAVLGGIDVGPLVAAVETSTVTTGEHVSAKNVLAALPDLPVVEKIAARLGADSEGERAAALELALEALYLAKKIDKNTGDGETVYG